MSWLNEKTSVAFLAGAVLSGLFDFVWRLSGGVSMWLPSGAEPHWVLALVFLVGYLIGYRKTAAPSRTGPPMEDT